MGAICSQPSVIQSRYRKDSILIFSTSDLFSRLYTISERVLNETPKSEIRLCRKNSSQNIYVLKKVPFEGKDFSFEAEILKRLNHPHIIKPIQCFSYNSQSYLILEYLQYGDLGQYLKNVGKLNEKTTSNIIWQISNAIKYLHHKGIYHRDIKPDNILLGSIGKKGVYCKLADFDSAGFIKNKDTEPLGTLPYMAPEIFIQNYNEKVDIWSLGVMMYRMLTGHLLFYGRNPEDIELKIRTAKFSIEENISENAKDLLLKMLNRDPIKRWSAEQVINHDWLLMWNQPQNYHQENINNPIESNLIITKTCENLSLSKVLTNAES